jgi:radical SAM protein with 4Fe4S-binding SPASM domain
LHSILNEAYEQGIREVTISGGEPFLYPNFLQIIESFLDKFKLSILTNGSCINEKMARSLSNLNRINYLSIQVSLDGATPSKHDFFRGKGTYDIAINAITNLKKYNVLVGVNTVIHKDNINYFHDLLTFLKSMDIKLVKVLPLISMGRARKLKNYILDKQEWWNLMENRKSFEKEFKMFILMDSPLEFLVGSSNNIPSPCMAGYLYLGIAPNGDVFPCPFMMDVTLGNINNDTLADIWTSSTILADLRNINLLGGSCATCRFKEGCRGGCRGLSYFLRDNYFCPDPYCPIADKMISEGRLDR